MWDICATFDCWDRRFWHAISLVELAGARSDCWPGLLWSLWTLQTLHGPAKTIHQESIAEPKSYWKRKHGTKRMQQYMIQPTLQTYINQTMIQKWCKKHCISVRGRLLLASLMNMDICSGMRYTYRVLSKHSTQDAVRSVGSACSDHVRWIDVLHIGWPIDLLEVPLYLHSSELRMLPYPQLRECFQNVAF